MGCKMNDQIKKLLRWTLFVASALVLLPHPVDSQESAERGRSYKIFRNKYSDITGLLVLPTTYSKLRLMD